MRERVTLARLRGFMRAVAAVADRPLRVYLVGGATAVLEGWRDATIDVDLAFGGEADAVLRALPALKERLNLNIELASPADFIPVKAGWEDRSPFVAQEGSVTFCHFDPYAQALAKIERGHETDQKDVAELIERGLVDRARLQDYFDVIEPELYRFPAIDSRSFRRAVEAVTTRAGA